jgi:hypothetical protein
MRQASDNRSGRRKPNVLDTNLPQALNGVFQSSTCEMMEKAHLANDFAVFFQSRLNTEIVYHTFTYTNEDVLSRAGTSSAVLRKQRSEPFQKPGPPWLAEVRPLFSCVTCAANGNRCVAHLLSP